MDPSSWTQTFAQITERVTAMIPALAGALAIVAVGWLLAMLLRFLVQRSAGALVSRFQSRSRWTRSLSEARLVKATPQFLGHAVYWLVLLFFGAAAVDQLPLPIVTDLLQNLAYYLPKVLIAVVVVFVGFGLGGVANEWITGAASAVGVEHAPALGRIAQLGIAFVAMVVGAQQIGLEGGFFTTTVSIVLATTLGGMALAFGLGSGPVVTNIMSSYYAAKAYEVGDVVRVAGIEGTVREINPATIVLDAAEGIVHLPAKKYCDEVSVVLRRGA